MSMEVINGFVCNNCTDVEYAKKLVDPARPEAGPVNQQTPASPISAERGPAVILGGALAGVESTTAQRDAAVFQPYGADGRR
jgi:hypothetical protein